MPAGFKEAIDPYEPEGILSARLCSDAVNRVGNDDLCISSDSPRILNVSLRTMHVSAQGRVLSIDISVDWVRSCRSHKTVCGQEWTFDIDVKIANNLCEVDPDPRQQTRGSNYGALHFLW